MKRYFLIAFLIHMCFFIRINNKKTLGDNNIPIKRNIPISYNIKSSKESIGQQAVIQEEKVEPIKEEPKKEVKEEIQSKISKNENKKEIKKEKTLKNKPQKKRKSSEEKIPREEKRDNFIENSDGTYTAIASSGIDFKIIKQVDPNYPKQAEKLRYDKTVVIEVKFLVGLNGEVEKIEVLKSNKKFGFDKEVVQALNKWKFEPIVYRGKKIKVYFNKEFVFTPKK